MSEMPVRAPEDNPFVPGFGSTPPTLAGREPEFADLEATVRRVRRGLYEQPRAIVGDRGMGKTALLIELALKAREQGVWHVAVQATRAGNPTIPLARDLRDVLRAGDRAARVVAAADRALGVLAAFALRHAGTELEIGLTPARDRGGSGDLTTDLGDVLVSTATAAREQGTALVLTVDEVQKMRAELLEALLVAVQRLYRERPDPVDVLPFALVVAGLPNTVSVLRERGGTFAERVRVHTLDVLPEPAVIEALVVPTEQRGIAFAPGALQRLVDAAGGWPVAVQQVGYEAWNAGRSATVTADDARRGAAAARRQLTALYDGRLTDLPDREVDYLIAAAWCNRDARTTAAVAARLGRTSAEVASYRRRLIEARGLLRADGRGRVAFSLPGLARHIREIHPDPHPDRHPDPHPDPGRDPGASGA